MLAPIPVCSCSLQNGDEDLIQDGPGPDMARRLRDDTLLLTGFMVAERASRPRRSIGGIRICG
jgi:hypothetical protein